MASLETHRTFVLIAVCLTGCASKPRMQEPFSRAEIASCHSKGGQAEHVGFGEKVCSIPYPDAGRACQDKVDCAGQCIFVYGRNPQPIFTGFGRCEPDNATRGSYSIVSHGKLQDMTSVD